MRAGLDDLDARALLDAAGDVVRRRRLVEVEDLEVLAQWAVLHGGEPEHSHDRLVRLGGEGTPEVRDFGLGEIALARGTGVRATENAIADVLDLAHRLPRVWAVCRAGGAEVWVARRVAKLSRHLSSAAVAHVDVLVAGVIGAESAGRVLEVAEGAVVGADPWLHQGRVEAERRARRVGFGRVDEFGLATVFARVTAGDAAAVAAVVDVLAQVLASTHPEAGPAELRSAAFGCLGRPAEALRLVLEHLGSQCEGSGESAPEEEPAGEAAVPARALAFPVDLLGALREADWSVLRPRAVIHVHLHESALTGRAAGEAGVAGCAGVARVEGLGPVAVAGLAELLGRAEVRVQPVIDLSDRVRSTAYEHPASMKQRAHLITGGDCWPFAVSTSRGVDHDHVTAYDAQGPPGQTGVHNCGPLGRRHHRWKTHAGYRVRQCGLGRYAWVTPHGLGFLVDHTGTHRISREQAEMIIGAPPGVDLYPGPGC